MSNKSHRSNIKTKDEDSDSVSEFESSESDNDTDNKMSGGESDQDVDSGDEHLDLDPDDENVDPEDDGEYDPTGNEELVDEDQEDDGDADADDVADSESEESDGLDIDEQEDPDIDGHLTEIRKCYAKIKDIDIGKDFLQADDDSHHYGEKQWKAVPSEKRISDPQITWYEITRCLGNRIVQLSLNAPPLIICTSHDINKLTYEQIAYLELKYKVLPYIIRRRRPGKKYELWDIDELDMYHEITDEIYLPKGEVKVTPLPKPTEKKII